MARIKQCDRCGKIPAYSLFRAVYMCTIEHRDGADAPFDESYERNESFDLCDECMSEIYKIVTGRDVPRRILD